VGGNDSYSVRSSTNAPIEQGSSLERNFEVSDFPSQPYPGEMSLQSPLSVGDIILLGKIAYKVARALSSGSKSAPAEFAEVQALLFSLKESFDLLSQTLAERDRSEEGSGPQNPGESRSERQPGLANILTSCRDVLVHLESFVEKYSVLDSTTEDQQEPRTRTLREDLKKSWKKVAWTKEGGDIAKLKQTLIAHTNALHLAITVINGQVFSIPLASGRNANVAVW